MQLWVAGVANSPKRTGSVTAALTIVQSPLFLYRPCSDDCENSVVHAAGGIVAGAQVADMLNNSLATMFQTQ